MILMLVSCQHSPSLFSLEEEILDLFLQADGVFALAFQDLQNDKFIRINAQEKFHAASTMKTPVMIEVFKQERDGVFSQSDSVLVKNEFHSIVDSSIYRLTAEEDSEQDLYKRVGDKRTIADLVYDMIIVSSNLATNLVIDLVDAKNVTATMEALGAKRIQVLRGVEDIKAFEAGLSNSTTAEDLVIIYSKLAKLQVVTPDASQEMINILFDQKFNEIIPAHLPDNVEVAHKTGAITGVHHDSGIVYLPDGRKYVLVLLSKELPDFDTGTELLAKVSKMIYDYVTANWYFINPYQFILFNNLISSETDS